MNELRNKLKITNKALESVNKFLGDENNVLINELFKVIDKYGGVNEINKKAREARNLNNLLEKLRTKKPEYVEDIEWLIEQRDNNAFINITDYRKKILGEKSSEMKFSKDYAVTLELSACQYFPFLIDIAKAAINDQNLMPGRIIRVRKMKEQEEDGDLLAMAAAMQVIGATYVETLDTKGTAPGPDGMPVNIHFTPFAIYINICLNTAHIKSLNLSGKVQRFP